MRVRPADHMTHAEFEELRSESHQFAVYPGHVLPDVESVVAQRKGYESSARRGVPELIAESTDPRTE